MKITNMKCFLGFEMTLAVCQMIKVDFLPNKKQQQQLKPLKSGNALCMYFFQLDNSDGNNC